MAGIILDEAEINERDRRYGTQPARRKSRRSLRSPPSLAFHIQLFSKSHHLPTPKSSAFRDGHSSVPTLFI